jgi:flagellar hook-associated protein 2
MSTIQLPGLYTGIDTSQLISQLMTVEQRTLNMYEERKSLWEERKEALSTLQTKLTTLKSSVKALSDSQELRAFQVASSDSDVLTAEASYSAFEGNHKVVINQLATAERWVHTNGFKYAEDYVGAGTFIYSYNHKETTITTTATTTLEDLVGLINNDANNPGVTASLLYYNNAYHLMLNGNEAGTDYAIRINSGSTEVWQSDSELKYNGDNATLTTKIKDLDAFSGTLDADDVIEITGADHFGVDIDQVDLDITDNTTIGHLISEINDAFDGRAKAVFENGKIILTDSTCGTSSLSITLNYNNKGSGGSLSLPMSFTTEGNIPPASLTGFTASDFTMTRVAQDSKIKVDGFPSTSPVSEVQTVNLETAPDNDPDGGTFTLTYRGETTDDIDWDATPTQIQAALEELSTVNSGDITVSASIDDSVTFTFADTLGDVDLLMINSSLTDGGIAVTASIEETTTGIDGYISRSSNTVDDVIHGVALHLHDITDSNGEQVTLTRNIESLKTKLNTMVDAYNAAFTYIQEKTGYNDILKTAGVLMGDYIVSNIKSQLYTPLISQTSGFVEDIDSFLTPGHIGLELDKDGVLSLDTNVLDEAIAEDYMDVLSIIGSDKDGSSDSNTIKFYGSSSDYTTAGTYDVEVEVSGGAIISAKIKLSTESTYRDATYSDNIVTGNSSFDDNGDPVYPENGLQLSVDLSQDDIFTATVWVKQGFAGEMEDALDLTLKLTTGSLQIDQEYVDDTIEDLQEKIELEEERLARKEEQLVKRFARLESTLALLQSQMAALGFE